MKKAMTLFLSHFGSLSNDRRTALAKGASERILLVGAFLLKTCLFVQFQEAAANVPLMFQPKLVTIHDGLLLRMDDVETLKPRLAAAIRDGDMVDVSGISKWRNIVVRDGCSIRYEYLCSWRFRIDLDQKALTQLEKILMAPVSFDEVVDCARAYCSILAPLDDEELSVTFAKTGFPLDPDASEAFFASRDAMDDPFARFREKEIQELEKRHILRKLDPEHKRNRLSLFRELIRARLSLTASQLEIIDKYLGSDSAEPLQDLFSAPVQPGLWSKGCSETYKTQNALTSYFVMENCGFPQRYEQQFGQRYVRDDSEKKVTDLRDILKKFGASLEPGEFVFYRPATDTLTGSLSEHSVAALQELLFWPQDFEKQLEIPRSVLDATSHLAKKERVDYLLISGLYLGLSEDLITSNYLAAMTWHRARCKAENHVVQFELQNEVAERLLSELLACSITGLEEKLRIIDKYKWRKPEGQE